MLGHRKKKKRRIKMKKDRILRRPEIHEEPLKYVKRHGPLWLPLLPLPFWSFFFLAYSVPSIISSTTFTKFDEPGHRARRCIWHIWSFANFIPYDIQHPRNIGKIFISLANLPCIYKIC